MQNSPILHAGTKVSCFNVQNPSGATFARSVADLVAVNDRRAVGAPRRVAGRLAGRFDARRQVDGLTGNDQRLSLLVAKESAQAGPHLALAAVRRQRNRDVLAGSFGEIFGDADLATA